MKIHQMLERPELTVKILKNESTYLMMHTESGLPYYIPSNKSEHNLPDAWVDDSIFLPLEESDFENDRTNYHFGYYIRFVATGHSILSFASDPTIAGMTEIQPSYTCSRIRYYIEDYKIIIDKIFDPLFPPRCYKLNSPTVNAVSKLQEFINNIMDSLCEYYSDKTV